MKKIDRTAKLWQLDIFGNSEAVLLSYLKNHLEQSRELLTVATPNPEQVVLSKSYPEFKAALQDFDLLLPDGIGLVWASQLLDVKRGLPGLKQRIPGVSVAEQLCAWATRQAAPILVVGGRDYSNITEFCPTATWIEGFNNAAQPADVEIETVAATIRKLRPTIVFVAFGAPQQELWVSRNRALLAKSGVKLAMVVGGSFDVLLGKVSRAPQWMQGLGLEWLYRLIQEPWRWKRQLKLLEFIKLTVQEALHEKPQGSR